MNFEQDLICPECCNPQLLGINFNEESIDINNFIELYSFCILNHKRDIVVFKKIILIIFLVIKRKIV